MKGIKRPSGILLAYPALNLDQTSFTPSLLLAINDQIVPYSFLKMCLQLYMKDGECDPQNDPYLSPILIPEAVKYLNICYFCEK
jgi:hormone-sensitive lipase